MHLSDDVPVIDPHTLKDLETHAKRVADNLQQMMAVLKTNLHKVGERSVRKIKRVESCVICTENQTQGVEFKVSCNNQGWRRKIVIKMFLEEHS